MARSAQLKMLVALLAVGSASAARNLHFVGKGAKGGAVVQPVVVQAAIMPQPVVTYAYATTAPAAVMAAPAYPAVAPGKKDYIKSAIGSLIGKVKGGGGYGPQPVYGGGAYGAAYGGYGAGYGAVMTAPVVVGGGGGVVVSAPAYGGAYGGAYQQPVYGGGYAQPGYGGGYAQPVYGAQPAYQPTFQPGYAQPQPVYGAPAIYGQQPAFQQPAFAQPGAMQPAPAPLPVAAPAAAAAVPTTAVATGVNWNATQVVDAAPVPAPMP
ncbi:MAG: hypothetical protein J3K34DRAFT_400747 [Monoraphidium minutum]|nr:MAG: hypothetical protein J3K34DRAFT_400747 [Monoraphidium minutum]